ncbi:MAG: c-type cytochrome [Chitinophagales bacterium]|jgi:mono/diheme cytochrome c family protein|nr:c-type cytochrome [Chitinophagales bacterium]
MQKSLPYIQCFAPLAIVLIIGIFVFNVATHGTIQHPGKPLYVKHCEQCHGENGEGIMSLVPPLASSDFAIANFDSIPCWIKHGITYPIIVNGKSFDQPMYGVKLDEIQTANIINYLNDEFLKTNRTANSVWVKKQWEKCK